MRKCAICGHRHPDERVVEGPEWKVFCVFCFNRRSYRICECGKAFPLSPNEKCLDCRKAEPCEKCGKPKGDSWWRAVSMEGFLVKGLCPECWAKADALIYDRDRLVDVMHVAGFPEIAKDVKRDVARFASLSKTEGLLSYAKSPEDVFEESRRISIKPGRFLRRIMKVDIDDKRLKDLANSISSLWREKEEPKIFRGEELSVAYEMLETTPLRSCMTGEDAEYMGLLANNPDRVSLAVFEWCGTPSARMLLWRCDDGTPAYDRIYTDDDERMEETARIWAERQGYRNAYVRLADPGPRFTVTLSKPASDSMPYLDSFSFVSSYQSNLVGEKIVLCNRETGWPFTLTSTDGLVLYACESCGEETRAEFMEHGRDPYLCPSCENLDVCDHCGDRVTEVYAVWNNAGFPLKLCEFCAAELSWRCRWCGREYLNDVDSVKVGDADVCKGCAEDRLCKCDACGEYIVEGAAYRDEIAMEYYCEDCYLQNLTARAEYADAV